MKFPLRNKLYFYCDRIAIVLLYIIMAECAVFGAGKTFAIGSLTLRMLLLAALLVVCLPLMIRQAPQLLKNRHLWLLAAFAVWLALEAIIGYRNKNSLTLLLGDLKGFAYFVAVIPALCVLNTQKRVHTLMKVIMYFSGALAVLTLFLLLLYNWDIDAFTQIMLWDREHSITMFATVSTKIPRLFFKSTPYFLCGCAFPIYFSLTEKTGRCRYVYPFIPGISLFALLLSYTRSIYLAMAIAAVFLLAILALTATRGQKKRLAKTVGAAGLIFVVLTATCSAAFQASFFGYALDRLGVTFSSVETPSGTLPSVTEPENTVPDDTDGFQQDTISSDLFRAQTLAELNRNILSSPIWGHGLGKELDVRNGEPNEYIYQDIWMKTGIIGLLLFLSPAALLLADLIKKRKQDPARTQLHAAWLAVLLGFMAFSYFNPYMNAALGILFYCCNIGVIYADDKNI